MTIYMYSTHFSQLKHYNNEVIIFHVPAWCIKCFGHTQMAFPCISLQNEGTFPTAIIHQYTLCYTYIFFRKEYFKGHILSSLKYVDFWENL